jgi:hypothetical protein
MADFVFESDVVALPKGAWSKTHRVSLVWRGREILAFTQGSFRTYLYPLYTPAGVAVTGEGPADHPHHSSVWIGADHLHCRVPVAGGHIEEYTYCFYLNETFQGRAPGRILEIGREALECGPDLFRVVQRNEWRGPAEWGAEEGRVVACETRTIDVRPGRTYHLIDIRSRLEPTQWEFTIGPTRHAYFNVRVAESMRVTRGGAVVNSEGRVGGDLISGPGATWVDYSGPVGGGRRAGIAVLTRPRHLGLTWFAYDWGTVTANPFFPEGCLVRMGESFSFDVRLVVHDGDAADIDLGGLDRQYLGDAAA